MFLDPAHGFIDQADQRRLETNTLDDIESGAMLTLAALVLHKIDAAPRMPQAGIPTEEKESSHRRHGTSSGDFPSESFPTPDGGPALAGFARPGANFELHWGRAECR